MSHLINPAIDTVYTPNNNAFSATWHNLHTTTEEDRIANDGSNIPLVFNEIIKCDVNPTFPEGFEIDEETKKEIDGWKLIAADCREGKSGKIHPLHVPRESYVIHPNKKLFDCMVQSAESVLGQNGFEIATVGTLDGYRQFFVSLAIKGHESFDIGGNDRWNQFFNLISSHNSLVSSSRMLSMIRMVCMNTVQASLSDSQEKGTRATIRHTKNSFELLTPEVFENDLDTWVNEAHSMREVVESLKTRSMSLDGFRSFACGVFTGEYSESVSLITFNRIAELAILFSRGKGNSGQTAYDGLNAFTEFFTSGNGVGKKSTDAQKIARANFGRGNEWKQESLRVLSDESLFIETSERGERLLNDYMTK